MMGFVIGSAFNPEFLKDPDGLSVPDAVGLIEIELRHLEPWLARSSSSAHPLALHLTRTPMCEEPDIQDAFVRHVSDAIKGTRFVSVGAHLTGDRREGLGFYGMSSRFAPSAEEWRRAVRFLDTLGAALGLPVWVENANFYSPSRGCVVDEWRRLPHLLEESGALLILDVAHMIVEAVNVGLPPAVLLGTVAWERVAEIHLNGLTHGNDGALHDGHGSSIPEDAWELTELCMALSLEAVSDGRPIYVTLESIGPGWTLRHEEYYADFDRLSRVCRDVEAGAGSPGTRAAKVPEYAARYLKRILIQADSEIARVFRADEPKADGLFEQWLTAVAAANRRIVLSMDDVSPMDRDAVEPAVPGFKRFLGQSFARQLDLPAG